ncbi:uncharacterized protein LOC113518027 [Galleria mellonella]|uniref:Uncharacterized protein LOC113518027 n=1 Tax=Galleria mellonella TaxID=7137 RepID=A0A6J1WSF9_GALME|nr:uncharacterized protein LOC113518027 [Galleria mellonella]
MIGHFVRCAGCRIKPSESLVAASVEYGIENMARHIIFLVLAVLVATSLAAPGERVRRYYEGGLGGYGGGGGGGGGGFGGLGPAQGGQLGGIGYPVAGSQSFSKSSASASSGSVGGVGLG